MNENNVYADLHLHTNRSDGFYSPTQVIDKARAHNLAAVAIVDHDEVGAIDEAFEYGKAHGVEVLTGVELSVSYRQHDLHVLAYCFDHRNPELCNYLELFKKERVKRAEKMSNKLAEMGMPISFDAVLQKAGEGTIGRPHVAHVLIDDGYVSNFQEAFNKYIGNGKPAYVDKYKFDIASAVNLIKTAGGICSIAHPGIQLSDDDLLALVKFGIEGIEVIHPRHSEKLTEHFSKLTAENGLLQTGGSDFHGGPKGEEALGKYKIPYDAVLKIKELTSQSL